MSPRDLAESFAHCDALVRDQDKDRWLATLLAPADKRPDLMALYAFNLEVASTRERVSDPLPGEVRLQWWRDLVGGEARGEAQAHPVAAALLDVIARRRLPRRALADLTEARVFDLYDDPFPTTTDFEGYAGETSSALMQLAAIILADGRETATSDMAGHCGVAYAIVGLLRAFASHRAEGRMMLPLDVLARHGLTRDKVLACDEPEAMRRALADMRARAREHVAAAGRLAPLTPPEVAPAFLPAAICRPILDRMDRRGGDPYSQSVDAPQWLKQWIYWKSARRAARMGKPLGPPPPAAAAPPSAQAAE